MPRKIEAEINGVLYTGVTASAKDQIEMLQIAATNGLLPSMNNRTSEMAVVASMASLDAGSLRRLKELVLANGQVIRASDTAPVAENLFQDEVHNYFLLLGKALRENIGPFWMLNLGENGQNASEE